MHIKNITDYKPKSIIKDIAQVYTPNPVFHTNLSRHHFMTLMCEYLRMVNIKNLKPMSKQSRKFGRIKNELKEYLDFIEFHNLKHEEMFSTNLIYTPKFLEETVKSYRGNIKQESKIDFDCYGDKTIAKIEIDFRHPKFGRFGVFALANLIKDSSFEFGYKNLLTNIYFDGFVMHANYLKKYKQEVIDYFDIILEASNQEDPNSACFPNNPDINTALLTDYIVNSDYKDIKVLNLENPFIVGSYPDKVYSDFVSFKEYNFVSCTVCSKPVSSVFDECYIKYFKHENC